LPACLPFFSLVFPVFLVAAQSRLNTLAFGRLYRDRCALGLNAYGLWL
jgi:hypothetical protein